jgi:hypothetical protein
MAFIHVTSVALGNGGHYVVARCDLCDIVAELTVADQHVVDTMNVLGAEALGQRGCAHVGGVVGFGSGIRPVTRLRRGAPTG